MDRASRSSDPATSRVSGISLARLRSGQILDWSSVDKSALLVLAPLPLCVIALVRVVYLARDAHLEPYLDRAWLAVVRDLLATVIVMTGVFVASWLRHRKTKPESRGFVAFWLAAWLTAFAWGSYLVGSVSTPVFGALLAVVCALFLLFDLTLARALVGYAIVSFFAPLALVAIGALPYGPIFRAAPFVGQHMSGAWVVTSTLLAFSIAIVPAFLLGEVVRKWQERDAELLDLARLDPLTRTSNRRYFFDRLEIELERAERYGTNLAVVLLDLDFFKNVNDRFGHLAGDLVLVHVADLLRDAMVRRLDVVGRYGGEEFAILLPDTDLEGARVVAERCRQAIEGSPCRLPSGGSIRLTASFGVVVPDIDEGADGVVRRVDEALYRAKSTGRNRVVVAA